MKRLFFLFALGGCADVLGITDVTTGDVTSGDDDSTQPDGDDGIDDDDGGDPGAGGDDGMDGTCVPLAAVPAEYRPRTNTTYAQKQGSWINASGGPKDGSPDPLSNHAATYVSLSTGQVIALTDAEALTDTRWDVAFKNEWVRLNSGDSGPGGRTAKFFPGKRLIEVQLISRNEVIEDIDEWVDESCNVTLTSLGAPTGALARWSNFSNDFIPVSGTFVIKRPDGWITRFEIVQYVDGQYWIDYGEFELPPF